MKKYLSFVFAVILLALTAFSCFAADGRPPLVVDNANLLTTSEEYSLESYLSDISDRLGVNIVVVTENSIGSKTPTEYADDYFDYNGYGENGALLLISMADRDWYVSTKGTCIEKVNYRTVERRILSDRSDGDYYSAFISYADACESMMTGGSGGSSSDGSDGIVSDLPTFLVFAVIAGVIISFLIMIKYTKQLKSVQAKAKADDYVVKDSLELKSAKDIFLYRTVSRVRRQTESSGGGGGSHTSSSGSSHGGGGGKF